MNFKSYLFTEATADSIELGRKMYTIEVINHDMYGNDARSFFNTIIKSPTFSFAPKECKIKKIKTESDDPKFTKNIEVELNDGEIVYTCKEFLFKSLPDAKSFLSSTIKPKKEEIIHYIKKTADDSNVTAALEALLTII